MARLVFLKYAVLLVHYKTSHLDSKTMWLFWGNFWKNGLFLFQNLVTLREAHVDKKELKIKVV